MSNLEITAKEDIDLIAAAIRIKGLCDLQFYRRVGQIRSEDIDALRADIEKKVRANVYDNINSNGELVLIPDDLDCALRAVELVFRFYKGGDLASLRQQGGDTEGLCRFVRGNLNRFREIGKDLKSLQDAMDAAARSTQKRVRPNSIIARDDVPIVQTCLRIEGYMRVLSEGTELGLFAVNSDIETEFRYLVDDNLDDEGNLVLRGFNDIMSIVDATEITLEVLRPSHWSELLDNSENDGEVEVFQAEREQIGRIADQLLGDIGAYDGSVYCARSPKRPRAS